MHPEVMIMMARQHTQELLAEAEQERLAATVARAARARGETHELSGIVPRLLARLAPGLGGPIRPDRGVPSLSQP
jgi:hypothetical protein